MEKKLQIFISSTYLDLKEERQAAVQAILKAGHMPAGMELFTAGDKSQMEVIKRWIDESDIYMLILGGRYGSIEPTTSLSYTELEYDYAVEKEKPLFSIVINESALEENVKTHGISRIERESPNELKEFRKKALSNMCSFFDDVKDIKLAIHETIGDFNSRYKFNGWVRGDNVRDTAPLMEEIARLTKERNAFEERLNDSVKVGNSVAKAEAGQVNLAELEQLLKSIEITTALFNEAGDTNDKKLNLLSLFLATSDYIITGVTNKSGIGEVDKFLYYNICSKLQIHGLVKNEKVEGVQWRRYSITPLGERFLAFVERKKMEKKTVK